MQPLLFNANDQGGQPPGFTALFAAGLLVRRFESLLDALEAVAVPFSARANLIATAFKRQGDFVCLPLAAPLRPHQPLAAALGTFDPTSEVPFAWAVLVAGRTGGVDAIYAETARGSPDERQAEEEVKRLRRVTLSRLAWTVVRVTVPTNSI